MLHRYDTYLDGSFGTHILFLKILLDADNNLLKILRTKLLANCYE